MSQQRFDKAEMVDSLLESLHYGKEKEDITIIEYFCEFFKVSRKEDLRDYLIKKVDFSEFFSELLKLVEPFAFMMNEIYEFLAEQRKTARALKHLCVGEHMKDKISFDIEAFPHFESSLIQRIERYLHVYSIDDILNDNISPLFLTEALLACGHCSDIHYEKPRQCQGCGIKMQKRFEQVFQQLGQIIAIIPEEVKDQPRCQQYCKYFERASDSFHTGTHWDNSCRGYKEWSSILGEVERRLTLVSKKQPSFFDVETMIQFFELPFWKERNRLYEVWTLTHFIRLLRNMTDMRCATFELTIQDGQWHLMYGDAEKPVVRIYGDHFELKMYYQHKLKTGLRMVPDMPIEPEMLLFYSKNDASDEPLVLIECKERKDYDLREVVKLAAFYRSQVGTELNIFCNYYDYSLPKTFQVSSDEPRVILCSQFRPKSNTISEVGFEFAKIMNKKLGPVIAVLIDLSGSMRNKDIKFIYQKLDTYLSRIPGSRSFGGIFAENLMFYAYDNLLQVIRNPPDVGNRTRLRKSMAELYQGFQRNAVDLLTDFYVITDLDFDDEDWNWLTSLDASTNCTITFVARNRWVSDLSKQRVKAIQSVKQKFF